MLLNGWDAIVLLSAGSQMEDMHIRNGNATATATGRESTGFFFKLVFKREAIAGLLPCK